MGWLIAAGVILLILFLPIGIRARYDELGGIAWITVGPVRFLLYPEKDEKRKASEIVTGFAKRKAAKGGKISDFWPLLEDIVELLSELCDKVRVKRLDCKVILAGDDPCDLSVKYGSAWFAIGKILPRLEHFLVIKRRNIEVECDYTADKTLIFAKVHITIPLVKLIKIIYVNGSQITDKYRSIIEKRKGGANL